MTNAPVHAPTAEGSLEKTPFVHLLVYVADRKLSGSWVLGEAASSGSVVVFSAGAPSKVKTVEPVAHLGRVLLEMGAIDSATLHASLLAIENGRELQGEYLVRTGALDRAKLLAGLREQTVRKLGHLFAVPATTPYAFYQDVNLLDGWGGPELTPLEVLPTIWKAIGARADEPIIDATLGRLGNTVLKLHEQSDVSRFGFTPHELSIIDLLRARPARLSKLIESQLLPERTARLVMYALVVTRHIDHRSDGAIPVGIDEHRSSGRLAAANGPPSTSIALGRVKLTRRAELPAPEPTREPPQLTPELTARRDDIIERAKLVDREDYFTILGVSQSATDAEIQAAYYGLAKTWHPDRQPAELDLYRDRATKVFARMSEAYETLSDAARQMRYRDMLKVGSGTPEEADQVQQIMQAASAFQRAEILWRNRDIAGAEPYIVFAYQSDPTQSDYAALYATLELSKRAADASVEDLIALCDKAIAENERCERAFFCRGTLYKRVGEMDAAIADFRTAHTLNPKNLDAAREVRVFEMRRSKQPERRSSPSGRRSTPPPAKSAGSLRPSQPTKRSSMPPKEGGVLSGLGKLFKR